MKKAIQIKKNSKNKQTEKKRLILLSPIADRAYPDKGRGNISTQKYAAKLCKMIFKVGLYKETFRILFLVLRKLHWHSAKYQHSFIDRSKDGQYLLFLRNEYGQKRFTAFG